MKTNQIWKLALIISLILLAIATVYPPQEKLKPGLDLAGGTSLIYDVDTEGLTSEEKKGLAQRMIPILRRRVDPTNVANIVMRPLGDSRIEIQLPLASAAALEKRDTYQEALNQLQEENINLLKIKRELSVENADIDTIVAKYAGDSEERKEILKEWAEINQERSAKQQERDEITAKMQEIADKLEEAGLSGVTNMASTWYKLEGDELKEAVNEYVDEKKESIPVVIEYVNLYKKKAPIVNELARRETGLNAKFREATAELRKLNLSQSHVMDVLALGSESAKRNELIETMKEEFPDRKEEIAAAVKAYDEYQRVGGRLDDPEDLKRMLKGAGILEFRILPTTNDGVTRSGELQAYVQNLAEKGPKQASDSRYVWVEVETPEEFGGVYENMGQAAVANFGEKTYVLASNQPNETMLHQTGDESWKLKKAYPTSDQVGRRAIGFNHDERAARLFFNLTRANIDRPLAIILDDQAITAPVLNNAIRSQGIITGNFSETEVSDMVNKLNAGSFPARLSDVPISEKSIGATIGVENRNQGVVAAKYGLIAVAAFMIIYYLLAGAIAVIALVLNLLFILAMMVMFDGTFTLPGIAGLILTIGMSVDANVLIFERIREEMQSGSSLRSSLANGYQRAFSTIFDANLTTFLVALILYMVASEEIKGFAIILMLGIASSMFTALFVTRVIFDFLIDIGLLKNNLTMLRLIKEPSVNWMSFRGAFFVISAVLIIGGLGVFMSRDEGENSKWDIEFTGGTSLVLDFVEDPMITESWVREQIIKKGDELDNRELKSAKVYSVGEKDEYKYELLTTATNKTTAMVEFAENGQTAEQVMSAIVEAGEDMSGTLYNLQVSKEADKTFEVSTSQVNKELVRNVLSKAFGDKAEISEPEVDAVVTTAVRDAFGKYLKTKEDLGAEIESVEKIDPSVLELADYIGGVQIKVSLGEEVPYSEISQRLKDIRFKSDTRDLVWHQYSVLNTNFIKPDQDDTLKEFIYVSVHPDAGYRDLSADEWDQFTNNETAKIKAAASLETTLSQVTQVDPSVGKQAMYRAIIAIILSLITIVAYIWIRFGTANFGFAAIVALVHDVCIVLGLVTGCTYIAGTALGELLLIQDFKIDLAMIAAFLTIIGYSLNDTIVVFDRVRENRGKQTDLNKNMVSRSINQTLSRTLLTSFTTFMVVLIMYIWGGEGLRGFTFAMLVGILVGTYSSIAIASPILLIGSGEEKKSKKS